MATSEMSGPAAPPQRPHEDKKDLQAYFAKMSATAPPHEEFRAAFLHSKLRLVYTHPQADLAARDRAVASMKARLGPRIEELLTPPVPGGVGYGMFYTPAYQAAWDNGTAITCDFVCPAAPGGNVNTWLYLTATNRSSLGVEALVAYHGQDTPYFKVFDWGRADNWQTNTPFTSLGDYLDKMSAHGFPYPVLPVWNSTWLISPGVYRNQVMLYNHTRGGWDIVYQNDYAGTGAQQRTAGVGFWGPIVETFQSFYNNTTPMGVLSTQLVSADSSGQWGTWAQLAPPNSYLRTDNVGFHQVFLDPNYAFTVNS